MSAAVSDFTPSERSGEKLGKAKEILLRLVRTPDIVSETGKKKKRPFLIGFAAETGRKIGNAKKKLRQKNLDMIVFNDVTEEGAGFDVDTNKVVLIDKAREEELPLLDKDTVADAILDKMVEIRA
jgi:phosphopantothenoylcysteine decarboxylase/phosphopantothenate--cysteine ligase